MTMTTEPGAPRSIRLFTALLLVATFACGCITGVALTLWVRRDFPHHGHPPGRPPFGPLPLEVLGLSPEQRQRAEAIFERHRPELEGILAEGFPKVRKVNEQIESEIRELLTPEQRTRLDEWKAHRPPPHLGPPRGGLFPGGPPPDDFGGPPPP